MLRKYSPADEREIRSREGWENESEDGPLTKLVNMLLLDMIKGEETTVRVRSEGEPAVQTYGENGWDLPPIMTPPSKLLEPMIWRLKYMTGIDVDEAWSVGAGLRLLLGRGREQHFDLSFSRSAAGSAIVVTRVEAPPTSPPSDDALARRAWIMLAQADDTTERGAVLSLVRRAVALLPEKDGRRCDLLRRAVPTCGEAGLYDEALALLAAALGLTRSPRVRCHLEHTTGYVLENMHRLDDAARWYERALASAAEFPPPHAHAFEPLLRLAHVALARQDLDDAERWLVRAETLVGDVFGATSAMFVSTRHARAALERARGNAVAARAIATEALDEAQRWGLPFDEEQLQYVLADLANARGDASTAGALAREILKTPSRNPQRARAYALLARSHRAAGRDAEALAALRSGATLASGALAGDHPLRLDVERELALLGASSPYR